MLRSMYSAVSGLKVHQFSMDVIGNNIANVSTTGYKSSRAMFQDLMSQTLVGGKASTDSRGGINPTQVGNGAYLAAVDNIFEQGVLKSTNRTGDLAIQGEGFFVVRGEGELQNFYTRAGDFNFDSSGTLVNPSGYKVQGWMSDPVTGELNNRVTVKDIVLGPEYKIMQPKASSKINLAGTLDTRATASTLSYQSFLTQATARQNLSNITNAQGIGLDLVSGEPVTITAHATGISLMSQLVDKNGTSVSMSDGDGVTFTFGNTPYTINYSASGGQNDSDGKFNTVAEFIEEVNNIFKQVGAIYGNGPVASMSLQNGQFKVSANSSFELTSVSGDSSLQNILSSLTGAYAVNTSNTSGEVFFSKTVTAMEDFKNLNGLALQVSNALNGNVVSDGFNVEFLENNFGMKEGESISFNNLRVNDAEDGTGTTWTDIAIGPFVYTEDENPIGGGKFHTVQELGQLIKDAINENADNTGSANPAIVNFGLIGNKLTFNLQNGGAIQLGAASMNAAPGGEEPNPYLKSVFDRAFTIEDNSGTTIGRTLTKTQSYANLEEISGKGRIVYSYNKTQNNLTLNADNGQFNMNDGDTLTFVVNGTAYTTTFTEAAWTDGTAAATILNTLLTPAGINVNYNTTGAADGTGIFEFTSPGGAVISDITTSSTKPNFKDLLKTNLKNVTLGTTATTVEGQVSQTDAISGLSITKGYSGNVFTNNVIGDHNNIGINNSITSERFMTQADKDTLMVNLFSGKGEAFNFTENQSTLSFAASVGNKEVTGNNIFPIKVHTTYGELAMAMEEYLGLGRDFNSMDNVIIKDGALIVTSEKGTDNNIDYFNISGVGSSDTYGVFNQYMKADSKSGSGGTLSTNMEIYDEQGNAHIVNFKFALYNEEQNEWKLTIDCDDPTNNISINGATSNELVLKFNSDGTMAYIYDPYPTPSTIMVNPTLRFSAQNGTNTIPEIALNLGSQGGTDGMVLSAAAGTFTQNSSDGYAQGTLESRLFNPAGELVGSYTNGQIRVLAQVALATFVNNQGLEKVGDSLFAQTANSGQATIGAPQSGGRGDLSAGMLENSNVDLSTELVNMITTERGYQANSKIVSTSDEMIQELLNMKR